MLKWLRHYSETRDTEQIMLQKVGWQSGQSWTPTLQVTFRVSVVVLFYFVCHTPRNILLLVSGWLNAHVTDMDIVATMSHVCFAAIYLNSSVNPILYALLNRQLRDQHEQA
jgi:hypothetical protein